MLILDVFILVLLLVYAWTRRRLYKAASKLDGPFAFPFVGSIQIFARGSFNISEIYYKLKVMCCSYPNLFKLWIGPQLYFIDSRPEDIAIVLKSCLNKSKEYSFANECCGNGLLTVPTNIWKIQKKLIQPSFSIQAVNTFHEAFVNEANRLIFELNNFCGKEKVDLFPKIFRCTMNMVCENLCDVDSTHLEGHEQYIADAAQYSNTLMERILNPHLYVSFLWKRSSLCKKQSILIDSLFGFIKKIVAFKRSTNSTSTKKNIFLNQLIKLKEEGLLTEKEILSEIQTMFIAGSETSATALSYVILAIGINPQVQKNVVKEVDSILEGSTRDPTVDDLNKMDYLERVIKESMRLLPSGPLIARHIDKDVELSDGTVLPSGTSFIVPLFKMNTDPKIWKNSSQFDPDRFLPEEVKTRHPHSFIPFGVGPRDCIGAKLGMWSMKVILSLFFKNYKIISVDYKTIDEIEKSWVRLAQPKSGCHVIFEKRLK